MHFTVPDMNKEHKNCIEKKWPRSDHGDGLLHAPATPTFRRSGQPLLGHAGKSISHSFATTSIDSMLDRNGADNLSDTDDEPEWQDKMTDL